MKKDWEERSLGDICEFRNGLWKGKKPPFIKAKVIRMTNFTKDCEMNNKEPIELEVEKKQFESRNLTEGDLLIEKSGGGPNQPVGRVVRFKSKDNANYSFSNFTTRMRIIDQSNISSKYLHKFFKLFYLTGKTEKFQKNSTNIRNLQLKDFKEIQIPLPSIQEQKRIVKKLDTLMEQIDKAIQNVEQNIQNAEDLFQSKLNEIFNKKGDGWKKSELIELAADVSYPIGDGDHGQIKPAHYTTEGVPYIRVKDFNWGEFVPKNMVYISEETHLKNLKSELLPGDILLAKTGATLGKCCIVPDFIEKANTTSSVGKITLDTNKMLPKYLLNYFLNKSFQDYLWSISNRTAQPGFNNRDIKKFVIKYPPIYDQKRIVDHIDTCNVQIQSLLANYQKELNALDELKKSILEKAFNGEL